MKTLRSRAVCALAGALFACDLPSAPPRFQPTFVVQAEPIVIPVTGGAATSSVTRDLRDIDRDVASRARGGALVVDIDNPGRATGQVRIRIEGGGHVVEGDVRLSAGNGQRIAVPEPAVRAFLGSAVTLRATGTLCPAQGCTILPPPHPAVTFRPRIEVTIEIGGEG